MKPIIFLLLATLINACVSSHPEQTQFACISESELEKQKTSLAPLLSTISSQNQSGQREWKELRNECWKKSFQIGPFYVFLYRDPNNQKLIVTQLKGAPWTPAPKECLQEALSDIERLNVPSSDRIISGAKKHYGALWRDLDIGPSAWLNCKEQKNKNSSYYSSLDTFMHELRHLSGGIEQGCSFNTHLNQNNCFSLPKKDFVLDGLTPKTNWPGVNKETIKSFKSTQDLYLNNSKSAGSSVLLLDELRSYITGLQYMSASIGKVGKQVIYDKDQKRTSLAPLLAVYNLVSRYQLARTKKDSGFAQSELHRSMAMDLKLARLTIDKWFLLEDQLGLPSSKTAIADRMLARKVIKKGNP